MSKILIVEDNEDIAGLYRNIFRNHETEVVRSGEHAIAQLEKNRYHLVLLDMHLPFVSGMEVLKYLRKKKPSRTGVFVISADDTLKYEAMSIGIEHWMTKPIELDELMRKAKPYLL